MRYASKTTKELVIRAGAAQDATGTRLQPACLHLREGAIIALGHPDEIETPSADDPGVTVLDLPDRLILPGFVNAHAHLDLSAIGPVPFNGDFSTWIDDVRSRRPANDAAIRAATGEGITLSQRGGTAIIGDIAGVGSLIPSEVLAETADLRSVSFIEIFGIGRARERALAGLDSLAARLAEKKAAQNPEHRLGLQPHAPYSASLEIYEKCARLAAKYGLPLSTHLAETPAEIEFTQNATGPLADFLRSLGLWDDSIKATGHSPIEHLAPHISSNSWLLAHVNYLTDDDLKRLAQTPASIAYCPRASAYFGHEGHRYQEMLETGINVCLGTDSILCLETPERISIWDEMRFLFQRDGTDAARLLEMATTNGAAALGFDPALVTLSVGAVSGLNAVLFDPADSTDPLAQALRHEEDEMMLI